MNIFGTDIDPGNTLLGPMFGVGSSSKKQSGKTAESAYNKANQYWDETSGLRTGIIDRLTEFVEGGFDPTKSPMYAATKNATEQQYGTALDNLLASLPAGGSINEGITGLEVGKATNLLNAISQILQQEYNAALGIMSQSPAVTFQGLGTGGNINAPVLTSNATENASNMNAFGNIGSSIMGGLF